MLPFDILLLRILHSKIVSRCMNTKRMRNLLLAIFLVSPLIKGNMYYTNAVAKSMTKVAGCWAMKKLTSLANLLTFIISRVLATFISVSRGT
jgi:hypothetical protein